MSSKQTEIIIRERDKITYVKTRDGFFQLSRESQERLYAEAMGEDAARRQRLLSRRING